MEPRTSRLADWQGAAGRSESGRTYLRGSLFKPLSHRCLTPFWYILASKFVGCGCSGELEAKVGEIYRAKEKEKRGASSGKPGNGFETVDKIQSEETYSTAASN